MMKQANILSIPEKTYIIVEIEYNYEQVANA